MRMREEEQQQTKISSLTVSLNCNTVAESGLILPLHAGAISVDQDPAFNYKY